MKHTVEAAPHCYLEPNILSTFITAITL